ncbi:rho guanine nucleotide exchange factor 25-like [Heterodontus francisci]|uniref:rho guanine nucleotide exchange factor 25-like n=1 Tax=Heterodontus francisci TaxID=7792 RepID=UPI00355C4FBC
MANTIYSMEVKRCRYPSPAPILEPGCCLLGNLKDHLSFNSMNSSMSPGDPDEKKQAKALKGRKYVLNELVQTENVYVKDLGAVVEGFMKKMEEKGIPDDMKGRDKIVFGNVQQIYDWHNNYFLGELENCLQEPEHLAELFIKHERRLDMYVVYCQNKPKSEYIVIEYDAYFEEVKLDLGEKFSLSDYLIKPIQRITKYQLLLKDFLKYSEQAGLECSEIAKAVDVMYHVPKRCNDMMNLGRLEGFKSKLTAQGKLLQQDTFLVIEQDSGVLSRSKERRVFLFEQILIFSELLNKGSSTPRYQFKQSIKMNNLKIEDNVDNELCKFALISHGSAKRFILQAPNTEIWQAWIRDIKQILDIQQRFLNALQSPIDYQKKELGPHIFSNTQARRLSQPNGTTGFNE